VKIDLSKIEGEPESFAETVLLGEDRLDPSRVAGVMTVRLEGKVRPAGEHFLVDGTSSARGPLSCVRCLEPVEWTGESSFSFEVALGETAPMDPEVALDEADLDLVFLPEPMLDLEDVAVEQVELELPMRILCSDDCAGLCPQCGANRNHGACRCEPEADPRWATLKDLAKDTPAD